MELFNIILLVAVLAILAETTIILSRTSRKTHSRSARKLYVDTSALMDGRILAIAKTRFLGGELIIPRSVIREMQLLADGKDTEKRTRARFGMDVANELTRADYVQASILQDELDHTPVDERLLELAKDSDGAIITNDFNLGKVAATEGIEILNVNELTSVLRAEFLPGETFQLNIASVGSNANQGLGYLPDGTMVVVDNAAKNVGKEMRVEFVRFIQTSAGRMMFAKPVSTLHRTNGRKPISKKPVSKPAQKSSRQNNSHKHTGTKKNHRPSAEDSLFETIKKTQG